MKARTNPTSSRSPPAHSIKPPHSARRAPARTVAPHDAPWSGQVLPNHLTSLPGHDRPRPSRPPPTFTAHALASPSPKHLLPPRRASNPTDHDLSGHEGIL